MKRALPLAALALCAFGIGVTEFAPMGLLPLIASDLAVTIPTAGLLVTGYAVGVMFGAPVVTLLTLRMPRKLLLILLMGVFTLGNFLAFVSNNYATLFAARVFTSLCQGALFGVGSMVAASLVPAGERARAIATIGGHVCRVHLYSLPDTRLAFVSTGLVPAAIAKAVFDATGVRLRSVPLTPAKVKLALGTA